MHSIYFGCQSWERIYIIKTSDEGLSFGKFIKTSANDLKAYMDQWSPQCLPFIHRGEPVREGNTTASPADCSLLARICYLQLHHLDRRYLFYKDLGAVTPVSCLRRAYRIEGRKQRCGAKVSSLKYIFRDITPELTVFQYRLQENLLLIVVPFQNTGNYTTNIRSNSNTSWKKKESKDGMFVSQCLSFCV